MQVPSYDPEDGYLRFRRSFDKSGMLNSFRTDSGIGRTNTEDDMTESEMFGPMPQNFYLKNSQLQQTGQPDFNDQQHQHRIQPTPLLGLSDAEYLAAMRSVVLPIAHEFKPDIILISAGFDAAYGHDEALGGYSVTPGFFAWATHQVGLIFYLDILFNIKLI